MSRRSGGGSRRQRQETLAVEVTGLVKHYGDVVALEVDELEVPQGQSVVLVGHNGSGKSTLLSILAGTLEASEGTVRIEGDAPDSMMARAGRSWLPDNPVLYDDLSVLEHLEYVARLHGVEAWDERAHELLERLGLTARAEGLPSRFSRGLRQKTAIALALVRPFDLLLVDEPFVGLDPQGRDAMVALLEEAHTGGAAVIVATHQMDFVQRADRCLALRDGDLVFDGPADGADVDQLVLGERG